VSYSKLILKDRPDIVWALDDITESSSVSYCINFFSQVASDYAASINQSLTSVLDIPLIFGGGKALILNNSSSANLSIPLIGRFSERYSNKSYGLEFWLKSDKVVPEELTIAKKRNFSNIGLFLKENYLIYRYGTSSSFIEVSYGLAELDEPTHIVMNYSPGGIELLVNGVSTTSQNSSNISLPIDPSHSSNDYMDFYGHPSFNITVDSIAMYPFTLSSNTAKRHYVYGLGKDINENIFFNLGGDYYNFSTVSTRKSLSRYYQVPADWQLIRYDNLIHNIDGIKSPNYYVPEILSFDNKISTSNDQIAFTSSAGVTSGTYIDIKNLQTIFNSTTNPFFVKVKFDGALPADQMYQTIMSYGIQPFNELVSFNLKNNSGSYSLLIINNTDSSSVSFSIPNITSSPTAYIGMEFDNQSTYYFSLSGSALQSASTTTYSGSVFGTDPLVDYFPAQDNYVLRIGSAFTYDTSFTASITRNIRQFAGTFIKFLYTGDDFSASTFSGIDSYDTSDYSFLYDTDLSRFRVETFGNANFIIHGIELADQANSGSAIIVANRFEFGYPDVLSGSQVSIYATLYDYSDNVIYAKTKLSKINSLEWINLIDLTSRYLRFDIDIKSTDSQVYPPTVKYFNAEAYPYLSGSYVEILDNGGDFIRINSASSKQVWIPELDRTPTIFLNESSGVRVYRNTVDIEFDPSAKEFEPSSIPDLKVYYDSRFPLGLSYFTSADSTKISWTDLSANLITASSSNLPEYRIQSLNLLQLNQSNGSESGQVTGFLSNAVTASSSIDTSVSGFRSILLTPDNTSTNSYIQTQSTGSVGNFMFAGETYSAVGTVILTKEQALSTASSRRIVVLSSSGGAYTEYYSASVPNTVGSHSVSVTFTLASNTTDSFIRFYNGSSAASDYLYWDQLAVYSGSTVSGSAPVWYQPLEFSDDRPVYKFNGYDQYFSVNTSLAQPVTVYVVGRSFNDDNGFIGNSASAPSIYTSSGYYRMFAGAELVGASVNKNFNTIVGVFNSTTSSLFVNDNIVSGNAGTSSVSTFNIGYRQTPGGQSQYLKGDVAAVLVYSGAHTKTQIDSVKSWLDKAFNLG